MHLVRRIRALRWHPPADAPDAELPELDDPEPEEDHEDGCTAPWCECRDDPAE